MMHRIGGVRWAAALALTAQAGASVAADGPIAQTSYGTVRGVEVDGLSVFRGVPFASPPVAALRWHAPVSPSRWNGVRSAADFAPACPQAPPPNPFALKTSEDCLYLNIWSPPRSSDVKLPVMVWIYGGGFTQGATSLPTYSGEHLARHGVVVVSIAYRVGAFGFLAHPELTAESGHGSSGNFGLLDQIAGLKWVRDNIAAFGGDPRRVTIFGESAGGISVSMLAASPLAKGLFHGAISESGGSFGPPQYHDEGGTNVPPLKVAEQRGQAYLNRLGVKTIAQARKLSVEQLLAQAGPPIGGGLFWPTFDGYVLPSEQYGLYVRGRYNDTPVLIGTNADEGAAFPQQPNAQGYLEMVRKRYGAYADRILAAYPGSSDAEALRSGRDLFRDTGFAWPTWTWARLQTRTGGRKAFVYFFDHRPPYPNLPRFADWGAAHGAEVPYVFGTLDPGTMDWTATDRAVSDAMVVYWTNFAKTGDPNGAGLPSWPAFSETQPAAIHFRDSGPIAGEIPNLDKLTAVDGYFSWRRQADAASAK